MLLVVAGERETRNIVRLVTCMTEQWNEGVTAICVLLVCSWVKPTGFLAQGRPGFMDGLGDL